MEININWEEIHEAATNLDNARHERIDGFIPGKSVTDAFGGTYFPQWFEAKGLHGLQLIANALSSITSDAWNYVHGANSLLKKKIIGLHNDKWCVKYPHGAVMLLLYDKKRQPKTFNTHRGAKRVANRRHGIVVPAINIVNEKRNYIFQNVKLCIRVMFAARKLFDTLKETGIIIANPNSSILAGHGKTYIHLTGLKWLDGCESEEQSYTIEEAKAFLERK